MKKITAKITTTALLFFLALFTLTTNLKAQAVHDNSKSGFFAGFVYLQGFQVDSSKSISESTATISYEVTSYTDAKKSLKKKKIGFRGDSFCNEKNRISGRFILQRKTQS